MTAEEIAEARYWAALEEFDADEDILAIQANLSRALDALESTRAALASEQKMHAKTLEGFGATKELLTAARLETEEFRAMLKTKIEASIVTNERYATDLKDVCDDRNAFEKERDALETALIRAKHEQEAAVAFNQPHRHLGAQDVLRAALGEKGQVGT